jgi:phosphatidylglycerol:prolipoprotein diacylglycerol transferase
MRQTLFRIPIDSGVPLGSFELPLFGVGLLLALWMLYGIYWLWRHRAGLGLNELVVPTVVWAVLAFVIVQAPRWAQRPYRQTVAATTTALESAPGGSRRAELLLARGDAFDSLRQYGRAAKDYAAAAKAAPQLEEAERRLAWLLATGPDAAVRDGGQAVRHAERALGLAASETAAHYDTLAVALAEAGRFEDAVAAERQAARLAARSRSMRELSRLPDLRERLGMFLDHQPYRESRIGDEFPQSLPVYGYGFMLFLGFCAAAFVATRLARHVGIRSEFIWDVGIWGLLAGVVGGRLFYLIQYRDKVFAGKSGLELLTVPFQLQEGGLVLLGGLLGGSAMFVGYCLYRKVSPLLMADVAVPAFFVALAFGRMGCLMNGCCYGDRCELPWAITFPLGSVPDTALVHRGFVPPDAPWVMPLQPTQIYSSINALILATVTATYFRYRHRDGAVLALGWLLYPISRFLIEFIRGDEMGQLGTSFTISQLVSAGLFVAGLVFLAWLSRRPRKVTPWRSPSPPPTIPALTPA